MILLFPFNNILNLILYDIDILSNHNMIISIYYSILYEFPWKHKECFLFAIFFLKYLCIYLNVKITERMVFHLLIHCQQGLDAQD